MNEEEDGAATVEGRVKWFDPAKGFGFVVAPQIDADVLLHANVLRNFGQSSVSDGSAITVRIQRTARGMQASEVLAIAPPELPPESGLPDLAELDAATLAQSPLVPARVKWFDKAKGFGFANVFNLSEDVFVHIEIVRRSGLADLQPGEAVCLRAIDGRRGRMAVQVLPWEAALVTDRACSERVVDG